DKCSNSRSRGPWLLHVKTIIDIAEFVRDAAQTKLLSEDFRHLPIAVAFRAFVIILAVNEDLEVHLFATHIDQPVFGNAGAMVSGPQQFFVFGYRTRTDDLKNPIGRAFEFNVIIP